MYDCEWTLETDCRGRSLYLPSPPNWQLGMRLKYNVQIPRFSNLLMVVHLCFTVAVCVLIFLLMHGILNLCENRSFRTQALIKLAWHKTYSTLKMCERSHVDTTPHSS